MSTLAFLLTQCVNALSQAALLFFLGVGLTLIFGIMRIVNFAHGALYMLGAFVGYSLVQLRPAASGSRWSLAPMLVGVCRHGVRARHPAPPLPARRACLPDGDLRPGAGRRRGGSADLGTRTRSRCRRPQLLSGVVFLLDEPFPVYRLFLAASGVVVAIAIWQLLERTRLGLLIRATSQNAEMVHALGTDVNLVRSARVRHRLRARRARRRAGGAAGHRVARHGGDRRSSTPSSSSSSAAWAASSAR